MNLFKKALTTLTVIATIAWSVGLSAFVPTAHALTTGSLIKTSANPGVYYYGSDGKRYVFPNESTYKSWYADFSNVTTVTVEEMGAIEFGGNVTMRPGVKLVQFNTVPKVYAVAKDGTLRWVETEAIATALYGANWGSMIVGIHESLVDNYSYGASIANANDYSPSAATAGSPSINVDKNLGNTQPNPTPATGGALSIALATDSPAGQSVPAGTPPASNVAFTKINFTAGSNAVNITKLTVTRSGLSEDANVGNVKLWNGATQLDTAQTLNSSHQAGFNINLAIAANSTVTLTIAADLNAGQGATSAEVKFGVNANTDIISNASSVTGAPVFGNTMVLANVAVGGLTVTTGTALVANVDLNKVETFQSFKLQAGPVEDVIIKSIQFKSGNNASHQQGDLAEIQLINDTTGQVVASAAALESNNGVTFDLSANPITIAKGEQRQFNLKAKVVNGSGRNVAFDINDGVSSLIRATGKTYGFGVAMTNTYNGVGAAVAINQGKVVVSKSATSPVAGNIAKGASDVHVASFSYELQGEAIRFGSTTVNINLNDTGVTGLNAANKCSSYVDNVKLVDTTTGVVLAGPVTPKKGGPAADNTVTAGANNVCVATFSSSFELPNGANTVKVLVNTTSLVPTNDVITADNDNTLFTNVRGLTSNKTLTIGTHLNPNAVVVANPQTVKGAILVAQMGASPVSLTKVVKGKVGYTAAYVGLDASSGGEDVRVSSIKLTSQGTALGSSFANARLINTATGAQVGQTVQPSTTAINPTLTFTFSGDEVVAMKASQINLALQVDILAGTGTTLRFNVVATGDISATGKSSSTGATLAGTYPLTQSPQQDIIDGGKLKVTVDADTATSAQLVSGSVGNGVVSYKFQAVDEAINVTDIYLAATTPTGSAVNGSATLGSDFTSVEAFVNGVKVGSTLSGTNNGVMLLSLAAGTFIVPKDGSAVLTIKANLNSKINVFSGRDYKFGIADADGTVTSGVAVATDWDGVANSAYNIVATGQDSGVSIASIAGNSINSTGITIGKLAAGNLMSVHDGILTVTLNASSPSGLKVSAGNQELARWNLTATGDDITINSMVVSVSTTCDFSPAGAGSTNDNADNQLQLATDSTIVYDAAAAGGPVADAATTALTFAPTVPLQISAGTTKTVKHVSDTAGCVNPKSIQDTLTSISYAAVDGIAVTGGVVQTKELPLSAGAISY